MPWPVPSCPIQVRVGPEGHFQLDPLWLHNSLEITGHLRVCHDYCQLDWGVFSGSRGLRPKNTEEAIEVSAGPSWTPRTSLTQPAGPLACQPPSDGAAFVIQNAGSPGAWEAHGREAPSLHFVGAAPIHARPRGRGQGLDPQRQQQPVKKEEEADRRSRSAAPQPESCTCCFLCLKEEGASLRGHKK